MDAASFYEERRAGLGLSFIEEVGQALKSTAARPRAAPVMSGAIRRKVVHRFPYSILFWLDGSFVRVVAIMNQRQYPQYWAARR